MLCHILICIIAFFIHYVLSQPSYCIDSIPVFENVFRDYNKNKIPGEKATINVQIFLQDIVPFSNSELRLDLYLSLKWHDPGLSYEHMKSCTTNFTATHEMLQNIWTPNVTSVNHKWARIHMSPIPNIFVMHHSNGSITVNSRYKIGIPCKMDFVNFPFDHFTCLLSLQSFYNSDQVELTWIEDGVSKLGKIVEVPQFVNTYIKHYQKQMKFITGNKDELFIQFGFKRVYYWYIFNVYIPTFIALVFTLLSMCFCMNNSISSRIIYWSGSFILITIYSIHISSFFPTGHIKTINIWLTGCQIFVFCFLLENAVVTLVAPKHASSIKEKNEQEETKDNKKIKKSLFKQIKCGTAADIICGFFIVNMFIMFSIGYWTYCLIK